MARGAGAQACPHCGGAVDVEAPPGFTASPGPAASLHAAAPSLPRAPEPLPASPPHAPSPVLPELADASFLTTLRLVLGAPRRFFDAAAAVPVHVAVRFGFVAAFVGILGTALKEWLAPQTYENATTGLPQHLEQIATCLVGQQMAWDEAIRPWLLARIPTAPVLSILLVYGLVHFFHVMARAMDAKPATLEEGARNLGFSMAPLALAALPLVAFGACFIWCLVLCAIAVRKTYGLHALLAALLASVPFFAWMVVELVVMTKVVLPCVPAM